MPPVYLKSITKHKTERYRTIDFASLIRNSCKSTGHGIFFFVLVFVLLRKTRAYIVTLINSLNALFSCEFKNDFFFIKSLAREHYFIKKKKRKTYTSVHVIVFWAAFLCFWEPRRIHQAPLSVLSGGGGGAYLILHQRDYIRAVCVRARLHWHVCLYRINVAWAMKNEKKKMPPKIQARTFGKLKPTREPGRRDIL